MSVYATRASRSDWTSLSPRRLMDPSDLSWDCFGHRDKESRHQGQQVLECVAGSRQHDHAERRSGEVLLKFDVWICGEEYLEPGLRGASEQFTVPESGQAL